MDILKLVFLELSAGVIRIAYDSSYQQIAYRITNV